MKLFRNFSLRTIGLALGLVAYASSTVHAQLPCAIGDDGFAAQCCDSASPNLPDFPEATQLGEYACISNCSQVNAFKVKVNISKLDWFTCDMARVKVSVTPATAGGPNFEGKLIAKYSRTWRISNGNQVWRFLLNGNMKYGPSIGIFGCPTPPHADPSHYIGYIDYTCSPLSLSPNVALNLNHMPGCISHSTLSANPLAGFAAHNNTSYHLVTPNNFNWLTNAAIQGRTPDEAVRPASTGNCFPSSYKCMTEIPIDDGEISNRFRNCLCQNFINGPWTHQDMKGEGNCQGSPMAYRTVGNFDPSIPTGLVTLPLGTWGGNSWVTGVELSAHFGYMRLQDPCGVLQLVAPERVHGVTTYGQEGYLFTPSFTAHKVFMDLQNHKLPTLSPTNCINLINGFGAPAYSTVVWNVNVI